MIDNVVVVGSASAAAKLRDAGITDFTLVDREVVSSVFDDETATWTVATNGGETCRGGVVVACTSPFVPWIPDLPGRNDFRGPAVAAAAGDTPFDPTGKRVAVIGGDFAAGQWVDRLTPSAASVEIFPYSPRRAIRTNRRRWRRRRTSVTPMRSPIDVITASGIRTRDGAHHDVDAIIYGTGFAVRKQLRQDTLVGAQGLRIQEAWQDGMEPYLGVAIHGFPNYFLATAPDSERYVAECLRLMHRSGSTRIEVRRSSAQTFNEYVNTGRPRNLKASAFDLASGAQLHDETYAGPATLTIAGTCREVRVHLTGHVDPIDGQYHWQGTVFDQLPPDLLRQARTATLAVGERNSSARITEATPQGGYSIAGAGPPPFALTNTELAVQRP